MAKDINLTSQQWNDIIFEGKNKDYGAYEMRQSSSKRHIIAFLSIMVLAIFVAIIPALASAITEAIKNRAKNIDDEVKMTSIEMNKPEDEIEQLIEEISIPDPILTTIQFILPDIVDDVTHDIATIEDLQKTDAVISIESVIGTTTDIGIGIDIAQLEANQKAAEADANKVWKFVEQNPQFPGGDRELTKFLSDNINYPRQARDMQIEGTVIVSFIVGKDGAISDIKILRTPHQLLSNEAMRVVKMMPKWIAGKQNGQAVRVEFSQPINFQLH
jgi:protein TonB